MDSKPEMPYTTEDGGSLDGFQRRMWPKSPLSDRTVGHVRNSESDRCISRAISTDTVSQQVQSRELSAYVFPSPEKLSVSSVPSTSASLTPSSKAHLQHASSTPSRQSNHSQKFLQMVPSNTIPVVKSPRSPSAAVERPPTASWSNESNRGSFLGISDGWSVSAFTELVASSHGGEGSSLGGEAMGLSPDKMDKTGGKMSASTSGGLQACSACLRTFEASSLISEEIIADIILPVVAVLSCGHVYHAKCLEAWTSEIEKYDPACPICTGEMKTVEISKKALTVEMETSVKRDRRSKNQAVITDASMDLSRLRIGGSGGKDGMDLSRLRIGGSGGKDGRDLSRLRIGGSGGKDGMDLSRLRIGGSGGKDIMKDSSSASRSPSAIPLFNRRFSNGSRGSRALIEVHSNEKRGLFRTKSSKE